MEFINHLLPENQADLHLLDLGLDIFHTTLVLFLIFGAFLKPLVPLHFVVVILVWISWLAFGLYVHQLGYCLITDWQWQVKAREGEVHLPRSFITYLLRPWLGDVNEKIVIYATGIGMAMVTAFSCYRFLKLKLKPGQSQSQINSV